MKNTIFALGLFSSFFLVSCDNPADATTDAEVSTAKEVATADNADAVTYKFTDNSKITFIGSKPNGSTKTGGFKDTAGQFKLVDGKPVSGSFSIDMNSIYSENENLTAHLKNEDFFDVPKYPTSKFEVTKFGELKDGTVELSGNLTMLAVTKNITVPAMVVNEGETIKLTSEFDINRQDWGIVYKGKPNSLPDELIRDEVVITFDLEAKVENYSIDPATRSQVCQICIDVMPP